MADVYEVNVQPGDVVFLATDGYSDNVFRESTVDMISDATRDHAASIKAQFQDENGTGGGAGGESCAPAHARHSWVATSAFVSKLAEQLLEAASVFFFIFFFF